MYKVLILLMPLITADLAQAQSSSGQRCESVEECLHASQEQKRLRLPEAIEQKALKCQTQYRQDPSGLATCKKELVQYANESLSCPTDLKRRQESLNYDRKLLEATIKEYGQVEVPLEVKAVFYNLTQNANKHFKFLQKPQWKIRAYGAPITNAHAGTGGDIVVSADLWTSQKYTLGEIAAVIAHEISHVITEDSLILGCLAHEWVSPDFFLNIEEITTIFREDFSLELPSGKQWSELSKSLELRADLGSKKLLQISGWDPSLMEKALKKMLVLNEEGTRGSHPTSMARLKNLQD